MIQNSNFFVSLYNYYEANKGKMPLFGFSDYVKISKVIVIDEDGHYVRTDNNLITLKNGKTVAGTMDRVPFNFRVGSGIKANTLYGKFDYFFPVYDESVKVWEERHDAFITEIGRAKEYAEKKGDFEAVEKFYALGEWEKLFNEIMDEAVQEKQRAIDSAKTESAKKKAEEKTVFDYIDDVFTFKIHGYECCIIEDENHREAYRKCFHDQIRDNVSGYGIDFITGEYCELIRVFFGKSGQASLISFNTDASCSHGYEQMGNYPMGVETAFKIASAYEYLLNDEKHHIRIGNDGSDHFMLFWSSASQEIENAFLSEINAVINPCKGSTDGDDDNINEDFHDEYDASEKVKSVFDGKSRSLDERNSTFYAASIVKPKHGSVFLSCFKTGKMGDVYESIDKYQRDFKRGKNFFVTPWNAVNAALRRKKDGTPVSGESDSKKHIRMRKEQMLNAIFGGNYNRPLFDEIIDRIYKESSVEFADKNSENKTVVNKTSRIACLNAFASQENTLDEFKFENSLDNLPYQTGAFYGTVEAIRQKYNLVKSKKSIIWKIETTEFRKGLVNQTSKYIIDKLKRNCIVLARYLNEEDRYKLVGKYGKEQKWRTVQKNGRNAARCEWVDDHDKNWKKWGEIDWAIYRMNECLNDTKCQKKNNWDTQDKAMFLIGFYRKFKNLVHAKDEK